MQYCACSPTSTLFLLSPSLGKANRSLGKQKAGKMTSLVINHRNNHICIFMMLPYNPLQTSARGIKAACAYVGKMNQHWILVGMYDFLYES